MVTASRTAAKLRANALGDAPPEFTRGMFGIIVDTREQAPWAIPAGVPYDVQALPHGDYTVAGYGSRVAIERKSLPDYVHSVFGDWERFRIEVAALRKYELSFCVVEASEDDVKAGSYRPGRDSAVRHGRSRAWADYLDSLTPTRVLESAAKLMGVYGLPVFFKGAAHRSATFAFDAMRCWHKAQVLREAKLGA